MTKGEKKEGKLTFMEAVGVIVGHGVGSGILSVPYLASRNTWWDYIWILLIAIVLNIALHLMIAELSYNNDGAQFVTCIKNTLLHKMSDKGKKIVALLAFALIALSVILNVCSYLAGGAAVFKEIFGWGEGFNYLGMIIFYILGAVVVYFGVKIVGISEKYSLFAMIAVVLVLVVATILLPSHEALPTEFHSAINFLALYGMISFALSSVMSVPTIVKGLDKDIKKIRGAVVLGILLNVCLIIVLTFVSLIGVGSKMAEGGTYLLQDGAIVALSHVIGGWVQYLGYFFTFIALLTSFWANTLNLRNIIHEQTKFNINLCWLFSSAPGLILALIFSAMKFTSFAIIASAIQIITGIAIVVAYGVSRKITIKEINDKKLGSPICGFLGSPIMQVLVVLSSLAATVGSLLGVR